MKIRPARQSRPRGLFLLSTYVPASRSRRAYEAAHLGSQGHFFGVAVCCFRRGINERPTTLFRQRFAPTKGRIQNTPKVKSLGSSAVVRGSSQGPDGYHRASGSRNKRKSIRRRRRLASAAALSPRTAPLCHDAACGCRGWAGPESGWLSPASVPLWITRARIRGGGTKRAPGSRLVRVNRRRAPRVEPTRARRARRRLARGCRERAWRRRRGAAP